MLALQGGHVRDICLASEACVRQKCCSGGIRQAKDWQHGCKWQILVFACAFVPLRGLVLPGINLAEAALQVAAEDDAIVSHSSVQLPVHSFQNRISRVANDANRLYLREMPSKSTPQQTLQVSPI